MLKQSERLKLLEKQVEELKKRPDVLSLDPKANYILMVPESTLESEIENLKEQLVQYSNIIIVAADRLKVVKVG